jgi:hypothetical protein
MIQWTKLPKILHQLNMIEGNFILMWISGVYNLPPAIVILND